MDSVRQQKIAKLIQQNFTDILLREGSTYSQFGLITVTRVTVTPDLLVARIYLSVFNSKNPGAVVMAFKEHRGDLRKKLGDKMRFQLRRIPSLEFFLDETLDEVFRLEEIFKQIKKDSENK